MRPVSFQRSYLKHPAGSCLVSFGETRVLCSASIEQELPPHHLLGQVGAVSVGVVDGRVVVDLDYLNDSRAEVDMNVVMRGDDFVEIQGTGEQGTFARAQLDALVSAAAHGIGELYHAQRA